MRQCLTHFWSETQIKLAVFQSTNTLNSISRALNDLFFTLSTRRTLQSVKKTVVPGCLGGSVVKRLPSAQVVIPGPGIESHTRFPAQWGACYSFSLCCSSCSLSLSQMNKSTFKKEKENCCFTSFVLSINPL